MTSWMTLVDPKNHILKISCHYLYFWLRYKRNTKLNKNVTEDGETDRQRDRQTLLKFNKDKMEVTADNNDLAGCYILSDSLNQILCFESCISSDLNSIPGNALLLASLCSLRRVSLSRG